MPKTEKNLAKAYIWPVHEFDQYKKSDKLKKLASIEKKLGQNRKKLDQIIEYRNKLQPILKKILAFTEKNTNAKNLLANTEKNLANS